MIDSNRVMQRQNQHTCEANAKLAIVYLVCNIRNTGWTLTN